MMKDWIFGYGTGCIMRTNIQTCMNMPMWIHNIIMNVKQNKGTSYSNIINAYNSQLIRWNYKIWCIWVLLTNMNLRFWVFRTLYQRRMSKSESLHLRTQEKSEGEWQKHKETKKEIKIRRENNMNMYKWYCGLPAESLALQLARRTPDPA